jgi:hypothetical protein
VVTADQPTNQPLMHSHTRVVRETHLQPDEPHGGQAVHRHHLLLKDILRALHQAGEEDEHDPHARVAILWCLVGCVVWIVFRYVCAEEGDMLVDRLHWGVSINRFHLPPPPKPRLKIGVIQPTHTNTTKHERAYHPLPPSLAPSLTDPPI